MPAAAAATNFKPPERSVNKSIYAHVCMCVHNVRAPSSMHRTMAPAASSLLVQTFGGHSCGPNDPYIHTDPLLHAHAHTHARPPGFTAHSRDGKQEIAAVEEIGARGGGAGNSWREDKVENWTSCWERRRERLEAVGVNRQDNSGRDGGGD